MWKIDEETGEWYWEDDGTQYQDEGSSEDTSPIPVQMRNEPAPPPDFQAIYDKGGFAPGEAEYLNRTYGGQSPTAEPRRLSAPPPREIPFVPRSEGMEENIPLIEGYGNKIAIQVPGQKATNEWGTPMTDEYVKDIKDTLALTDEEFERKMPKKELSGFAKLQAEREEAMPDIIRQAERYAMDTSGGLMDKTYYTARQKAIDEGIKQHDSFVYKREEAQRAKEAADKLAAYQARTAAKEAKKDADADAKIAAAEAKEERKLRTEEAKSEIKVLDEAHKADMEEVDRLIEEADTPQDKAYWKAAKQNRMAAYNRKRKGIIRGVDEEEVPQAPSAVQPAAPTIRPEPTRKITKGPPQGFKRAPDGNYYGPDPNRPGKYLRWKG